MGIVIHCDGASRGNPGNAAAAFVVLQEGKVVYKSGKKLGLATNNQAEYCAVIEALNWLTRNNMTEISVKFILDSQLVVNQLKGNYKIKNQVLLKLALEVKKLENLFSKTEYVNVSREKNKIADTLVNQILDGKIK